MKEEGFAPRLPEPAKMSNSVPLFNAGLFTDVKVDVSGIRFPLHRGRLANASKTFEDLLTASECDGIITIPHIPGDVTAFVFALEWMYRDYVKKHLQQLDCPIETLTAVLACADFLHIEDLMTEAEKNLKTAVDGATWPTILKSAHGFGGHSYDFVCTLVVDLLCECTRNLSAEVLGDDVTIEVAVGFATYLAQRAAPAKQKTADTCADFVLRYMEVACERARTTAADRDKWLQLLQPLQAEVPTLELDYVLDFVLAAVCC